MRTASSMTRKGLSCPLLQHLPNSRASLRLLCFTGTDNLQIHVTPAPEPFPHGKLLPISPTWPFSEVKSSVAVDRIGNVPEQSPDNTSLPQFARTSLPRTHRRTRAHVDFSSSLYQGSGQSASLEPSKDSSESLVQPRPPGGREAADVSGLPHARMLPPWSTVPVATLSAVPPSQPRVGTPSLSERPLRSDMLLPPPSSSPLTSDSPHSITSPKPAERPAHGPLIPQIAPPDSSSAQTVANALNPVFDKVNHTPSSPKAQGSIGVPHLGFSGSSTKQYSEVSPTEGPHSTGSPTPGGLSSMGELARLPPPPLAPGGLPRLPGETPSWSMMEVASSPASTHPVHTAGAKRAHNGVSLPTFKSTAAATQAAGLSLFRTTESVTVEMTSRELAPASTASDSANPPHLSADPENSRRPALSTERTSLVPALLPFTTLGQRQAILSGPVPASPSHGKGDLPSMMTVLEPAEERTSPPLVPETPTPQEEGNGSPPAATDWLLSSKLPDLLSTAWTLPLQKEVGMTAFLGKNEKANGTIPFQALPSKEVLSLHTVNGFSSDFSTDPTSSPVITTSGTNLLPSGSPPASMPTIQTSHVGFPSPGFSSTKLDTDTAAEGHSELPVSASKQVTASPSSTDVDHFSTMGDMKKPTTTDVFWSSLLAETGTLSRESTISGLQQQTSDGPNGHTINSASWEIRSASTSRPSGLTLAANVVKSQNIKATAGHSVVAEGFNTQDLVLRTGTNQPVQQSDVTLAGNHTDLWPTSHNRPRDFQTAQVEYNPSTSQRSAQSSHPLWLTWPRLSSTTSLQDMLSDGTDTGSQIPSDIYPSPGINASTSFQSNLGYQSAAESPPLSTSAFPRNPSKVLQASQHPKKWTGATTNAGSLFPGTPKTGMTAFETKASSSSTQTPSFALKAHTLPLG